MTEDGNEGGPVTEDGVTKVVDNRIRKWNRC